MKFSTLRTLGLGFTEEEYELYRFAELKYPHDASRYLSNRINNTHFRPTVNNCAQKHLLEDKWATHLYFSSLSLPVPQTYGIYDEAIGMTPSGASLKTPNDLRHQINKDNALPDKLVFKPRGGRQGRNIIIAELKQDDNDLLWFNSSDENLTLDNFLEKLPSNAFQDYDGGYHGWLVQRYINQHPFMLEINPHTVNTFRVITFIDHNKNCKIHMAALRLGRKGSAADNWDKGGISVGVDLERGRLGKGVFKPSYGGQWVSYHPDTKVKFEGRIVPDWDAIIETCKRASMSLSGVRSIGWDIAYTPKGPVIIEGNAEWSLPLTQVHTKGYLSDEVRLDLSKFGLTFPSRLPKTIPSITHYLNRQWRKSKGPRLLKSLGS